MLAFIKKVTKITFYSVILACILALFSICSFQDIHGDDWFTYLDKVYLHNWKHGYVLCGKKIMIEWNHRADKEYYELLKKAERECSK